MASGIGNVQPGEEVEGDMIILFKYLKGTISVGSRGKNNGLKF